MPKEYFKQTQIEQMVVLSTGHVPKQEASRIEELIMDGSITGMQRSEGWLIHTHAPIDSCPHLTRLLGFAMAYDCEWILFDRDAGTTHDLLPTFDW